MTAYSSDNGQPAGTSKRDRGKGHPIRRGNLPSVPWLVAEKQKAARGRRGTRDVAASEDAYPRGRNGSGGSFRRRDVQAKSKARYQAYEDLLKQGQREATPDPAAVPRFPSPSGRAETSVDFRRPQARVFWAIAEVDSTISPSRLQPGGHPWGVIGPPTAAGKTRLSDDQPKQETTDKRAPSPFGGNGLHSGYVEPVGADDLDGQETVWGGGFPGKELICSARKEVNFARLLSSFNFPRGAGPAEEKVRSVVQR